MTTVLDRVLDIERRLAAPDADVTALAAEFDREVAGMKELDDSQDIETRGAVPYKKTETSDSAWDAGKQEKALDATKANCRAMYAWVDPEGDAGTQSAYKFPHHFVSDGKPGPASTKACSAGIAAVNGGRGGSSIPDGDRKAVYNHLAHHLRDAKMEPPELKRGAEPESDMEYRQVQMTEFRLADEGNGHFEGYANLHGVVDSYGTWATRSTWEKGGLDESRPLVLYDMHHRDRLRDTLALFSVANDERGLRVKGQFAPTVSGQEARALMKMGIAPELSMGFKRVDGQRSEEPGEITAAKLVEVSLIPLNMASQPGAVVTSVRSAGDGKDEQMTRDEWQKRYMGVEPPEGSFEATTASVVDAVQDWARAKYNVDPNTGYVYVNAVATFPDRIVVGVTGTGMDGEECWQFGYVMNADETVTLGTPVAVELVTSIESADVDDSGQGRSMKIVVPQVPADLDQRRRRAAALRLVTA